MSSCSKTIFWLVSTLFKMRIDKKNQALLLSMFIDKVG